MDIIAEINNLSRLRENSQRFSIGSPFVDF
jgi:hypothetical protein